MEPEIAGTPRSNPHARSGVISALRGFEAAELRWITQREPLDTPMASRPRGRTMLSMTMPTVTELPLRLEPVTADPFAEPLRAAAPAAVALDRVMNYIECDLAAEVTLPQWRRTRAAASRRQRHSDRSFFAPARRANALAA
jgi:hypothetical protein